MSTVTVVSCCYGDYTRFVSAWNESVSALQRQPDARRVCVDNPDWDGWCPWRHPQAYLLQQAIEGAETDWVWILDIDDTALPDALDGIDDVQADVWQMGFVRSDGETYIPPTLTADEVLTAERNPFVGTSAIRTEAFHAAGGFQDVALQDWALWRALARNGATFESSGRAHFRYNRHPDTRGETELTIDRRPEHLAEMRVFEEAVLAAR